MSLRSLIILTYDEVIGSRALFDRIPFSGVDEYFVVDGGSKDGTAEFFKGKGVKVITQKEKGRGTAMRLGVEESKGEHLVFFSPDGNEDPGDILKIFAHLESGYEMVIASRFMKGGRNEEDDVLIPIRKWANLLLTFLVKLIWGGSITDTINGYRGVNRRAFAAMEIRARGFVIEYLMSIRALKLKMRVKEMPTIENKRIGGHSRSESITTGLQFFWYLVGEIIIGNKFQRRQKCQ